MWLYSANGHKSSHHWFRPKAAGQDSKSVAYRTCNCPSNFTTPYRFFQTSPGLMHRPMDYSAVQLRAMHRSHFPCEDAAIELHLYCNLFSLSIELSLGWPFLFHSFGPIPLAHLPFITGANCNFMPNHLFVRKPPCGISCCSYHINLTSWLLILVLHKSLSEKLIYFVVYCLPYFW